MKIGARLTRQVGIVDTVVSGTGHDAELGSDFGLEPIHPCHGGRELFKAVANDMTNAINVIAGVLRNAYIFQGSPARIGQDSLSSADYS